MRRLELPPPPWIVGHRGAAGEEVENTLESVRLAIEQRADMVEVDLQLTANRELVAFHDWTLERLAGRPGSVERMASEDLRRIDLAGGDGDGGTGTRRIPTLEELLDTIPEEQPLNLELKRKEADAELLARRLAGQLGDRERVLVSGFDWDLLREVRLWAPDLPLAPISKRDAPGLLEASEDLGAWSVHCHRGLVDDGLVESASLAGRMVLAYTVNEVEEARSCLDLGVAGLFTDFPGKLRLEMMEGR